METESAARVLGECSTREEALRRLKEFAKDRRKDLDAAPGEKDVYFLRGYSQRGGHDQRFGYAVKTAQRVQVEEGEGNCRILIWPEVDEQT